MSIILRWVPIEGADIMTYNIHRSMIGFTTEFEAPFGLVAGDNLRLKINNHNIQEIVFDSDLAIADLVDFLNTTLLGATAYKAKDSDHLIIRSDIREEPGFIEVLGGGSALSKLGISAGIISERSGTTMIGSPPSTELEYEDPDGVLEDFYAISTVDSAGSESSLSTLRQAINFTGPICVVEGCITDLQGMRVPDVKALARVVTPPEGAEHTSIIKDEIYVLTGEDGRFSLPILQGARVIFEIDDARVSDPITIPEQPYVFFDDLPIDYEYKFQDRS